MNHRRIISLLSAALLGISAAAFPPASPDESVGIVAEAANEQTYTYGDFDYSYVPGSSEVTLKSYLGNSSSVSISAYVPSPDGWKTVTKIGNYAFLPTVNGSYVPKNITSVTIPNTVTEIGKCAFARTPLTSVTIPSSVQTIKSSAFAGCSSMTHLRVEGAATIGSSAFNNCTSLRILLLHKDCVPERRNMSSDHSYMTVFLNCPNISTLNNASIWKKVWVNGVQKPVINSDSIRRELIKRFLWVNGTNCDQINQYCTALCEYIVATETKPWMGDAVKARQLNDWIVRHSRYEDFKEDGRQYARTYEENPSEYLDVLRRFENQNASSVFVSYGLDERGTGIGETVCSGFAKAYAMLLRTAGIESYVITNTVTTGPVGHEWNIVKINGRYYQCDVCASNQNYWDPEMIQTDVYTNYEHFLVSANRMDELQGHTTLTRSIWNPASSTNEAALFPGYSVSMGEYAMNHCNYNYSNHELFKFYGLKEGDWDFNGTANTTRDTEMLNLIHQSQPSVGYGYMAQHLHNLLQIGCSPEQWYNYLT